MLRLTLSLFLLAATAVPATAASTPAPAAAPAQEIKAATAAGPRNPLLASLTQNKFAELERMYAGAQSAYENSRLSDMELNDRFTASPLPPSPAVGALIDKWVATMPASYAALILRADYEIAHAFVLRGPKPDAETTTVQTAGFNGELIKARADLEKAATLTPKPILAYARLIKVDGLLGMVEKIPPTIDTALKIDAANMIVRVAVMQQLSPRSGGSYEAMLAFADQQKKAFPLTTLQSGYLDSIVLSAMGEQALATNKFAEAALLYQQAWAKEAAYNPALHDALAGYTLALYRQSVAAGNAGAEPEILQALNTLLQDDAYPERGLYYGLRGDIRERHLKNLAGAWEDYKKGAALNDAFSLYKVGATYCQGTPLVKLDRDLCVRNLVQAAARGNAEAAAALTRLSPKARLFSPDVNPEPVIANPVPLTELLILDVNTTLRPEEQDALIKSLSAAIQLPVKIINVNHSLELAQSGTRGQYHAPSITHISTLFKNQRPGEIAIALVAPDLFADQDAFMLGWPLPEERRGVVSVKRLTEPAGQMLPRLKKLIMRQTALAAGLRSTGCVMEFAADTAELDALPDTYCPADAKVLGPAGVFGKSMTSELSFKKILAPGNSAGLGLLKFAIVGVVLLGGLGYIFLVVKPRHLKSAATGNPDRDAIHAWLDDQLTHGLMDKNEYAQQKKAVAAMTPDQLARLRATLKPRATAL